MMNYFMFKAVFAGLFFMETNGFHKIV